jgi:nuclear transport factor 2 (NTF2) superfamily protein
MKYEDLSDEARELVLHGQNDEHLVRSSHEPIMKNLAKKMAKNKYDEEKARKLWGYHADRSAQSYHKQFGDSSQPWHKMFPTEHRKQAASHFEMANRHDLKDHE